MISTCRKIFELLNRQERMQAFGLLGLTIVMAFLELVGIASILPFIAVLSEPETIHENRWLKLAFETLGFSSDRSFLIFLGVIVLTLLVLNNTIKGITRWMTLRFTMMRGHNLSIRMLSQYLHQHYSFFLHRNSSDLKKSVLGEVQGLVVNIMLPFMDVIARLLVTVSIIILLVFVDPVLALTTAFVLGGIYAVIYIAIRKWLFEIGQERFSAMGRKTKLVTEALMGIKNLKLTGHEDTYVDLFKEPSLSFAKTTALSSIASEMPRYVLEVIAFGGILLIVLYQIIKSENLNDALPVITLYALAGYRLMPNLQAAFSSIAKMRFNGAVLERLTKELRDTKIPQIVQEGMDLPPLNFKDTIELKNVFFRFESTNNELFKAFNFTIKSHSRIGIVGKTGSGKTTLVDMILGLLAPTSGDVLVDGVALTAGNRRAWQKNAAYVTQHIYLSDDTIRNNIAFGLSTDLINNEQVVIAAKMAKLHDFIISLPEGYDTIIGENGVRLSGGQRQRLGIARALYLDRPVLVLDEATSALDFETEKEVMEAINNIGRQKTIIMIAHRLSSLENVDLIIDLNDPTLHLK